MIIMVLLFLLFLCVDGQFLWFHVISLAELEHVMRLFSKVDDVVRYGHTARIASLSLRYGHTARIA